MDAEVDSNVDASREITVTTIAGNVLVTDTLLPHETGHQLKERVASAGGPDVEHQRLLLQDQEFPSNATAAEMGLPPGVGATVTMLNDPSDAFKWRGANGFEVLNSGGCVKRPPSSGSWTHAVLARKPLPQEAAWRIAFKGIGSCLALGVATEDAALAVPLYTTLLGKDSSSWALCSERQRLDAPPAALLAAGDPVGKGAAVFAIHNGEEASLELPADSIHAALEEGVELRRVDGTRLLLVLPSVPYELVLFSDLPRDVKLYAAAST
eukprot:CAMPEP_0175696946 /NCGR_PEP_ID=MMETSP0097-20121207/33209_1 /TAXON_ID=311494 /ORGANISM="Alexandrium monilatum, Strain CCMP3105" /LENGTH=266 /DNA_ID=CAMNT_0017004111 /DNA_START=23 /DNA_END=820 /DNA_ORIENTATION=-